MKTTLLAFAVLTAIPAFGQQSTTNTDCNANGQQVSCTSNTTTNAPRPPATGATAAPDSEPKPTPAVCKADLKAWSAQKTESLTIGQIDTRMTEMVACADEAHHHHHSDKKMWAYLDEFYRTHTELANRAFDFITRHDLQGQFGEEENGVSHESASIRADEKP